MIVVALVLLGVVIALFKLRRGRKNTLAGLNHEKPSFTAAPPVRSMLSRKDFRL